VTRCPRRADMVREDRKQERARDGAAEVRSGDEAETQRKGKREHPLSRRHVGGHVRREVRGDLRHAATAASRAVAAPLARERDEVVQRAVRTP
jgi:hypothetical protein